MLAIKELYQNKSMLILSFAISVSYSFILLNCGKEGGIYSSLFYVFFLIGIFIWNWKEIEVSENIDKFGVLSFFLIIALHIGLLIGYKIANPATAPLWVVDSYTMHIPGAENIANFLAGKDELRSMTSMWDKIYITQIVVGLFFYLFGVSPIVSSGVLLCAKLCTNFFVFSIAKQMFDKKVAAYAVLIYALMPTVLFYTLVYYKEAFVQLLTVIIAWSFYKLNEKKRPLYFCILVISLLILANERFYLFPMYMITILLVILTSYSTKVTVKGVVMVIIAMLAFVFYQKYSPAIAMHGGGISSLLGHFKTAYTNFDDIDPINRQLPYVLCIGKIMFSPYVTLNKFNIFTEYSNLLTWGAIPNQITILLFLLGSLSQLRNHFKQSWYMLMPILLFILLFAYVAPFSGRQRDSFYPIISIYAGYGLTVLAKYLKSRGYLKN
ncbi:MAG: hypothetical protein H6Q73_1726 [Firmicutes bacterium]|nr:hypothetical protein [Bacillota bacterium]